MPHSHGVGVGVDVDMRVDTVHTGVSVDGDTGAGEGVGAGVVGVSLSVLLSARGLPTSQLAPPGMAKVPGATVDVRKSGAGMAVAGSTGGGRLS